MKNGKMPDPNMVHPIPGYEKEIYVKPTLQGFSENDLMMN